MSWKDKININNIESQPEPKEQNKFSSKFNKMFKKKVEIEVTSLKNEDTIPSRKEIQKIAEKDLATLVILILSSMGLIGFVTADQLPAISQSYLLGLDITFWWFTIKFITIISGFNLLISLIWKLRGSSQFLTNFLKFLPNSGKNPIKNVGILFLSTIIMNSILQFTYHDSFKTPVAWRLLESQQITSRDPEKREYFSLLKNIPHTLPAPLSMPGPPSEMTSHSVPMYAPIPLSENSKSFTANSEIKKNDIDKNIAAQKKMIEALNTQKNEFQEQLLKFKEEQQKIAEIVNKEHEKK